MNPDAFEQALRQSLDKFEVPYNSADWALMERELNKTSAKQGRWSAGLLALLFGGSLALTTTVYFMYNTGGELATAKHGPIQEIVPPIMFETQPLASATNNLPESTDRQVDSGASIASQKAAIIA